MTKHLAKKTATAKYALLTGALALVLATLSPLSAQAAIPELTDVSPASGTAAGGTQITITGTGFDNVTCADVTVGNVAVASCTVNSSTEIVAMLPTRTGTGKTIGPQDIKVVNVDGPSEAASLFYTYVPEIEIANENNVILGELASRSQRKLVTRSTSTPYQVFGTDSLSGNAYSYLTNYGYPTSAEAAYAREGDQPGYHENAGTPSLSQATVSTETYANRDVHHLYSSGDCDADENRSNTFDSGDGEMETFCTVFGPEIYSESFYATSAQALAFEWKALGNEDDFAVYAYLVAVADDVTVPTPSVSNHELVMHAVGSHDVPTVADDEGWSTSTANVNESGLYRFRFVNGSYDGTGGQVIGSDFYLGSLLLAGDKNELTISNSGDQVYDAATNAGPYLVTASATSGQPVSLTSLTPDVCTVVSPGATPPSFSINRITDGTCTLQASQGATGNYAPAATVTTSFDILATALIPGSPTITGISNGDTELTVSFTAPNRNGGSAITKYQYQVDSGAWVDLELVNGDVPSPFEIPGLTNGTTYQIKIRAVNSIGEGAESGESPGTPTAPENNGGSSGGSSSPVVVEPSLEKRPPVSITIGGFSPGSPALTRKIKASIVVFFKKHSDYKNASVTGYTEGPTVLSVDKALSRNRALNAIKYITKTLKKDLKVVAITAIQQRVTGSSARKIKITLTD